MYNWNTDTSIWDKKSDSYQIWKHVQLINYGTADNQKISLKFLVKNWNKIKPQLDPLKVLVLEYWIWDRLPQSLPNYKNGSWSWL